MVKTTVHTGNSSSEGIRKTVRVIGVNFSEILINGKENLVSARIRVIRVRVIEGLL